MAVVKINPLKLAGPWTDGYVLERQHTLSSDFLGYDSNGHAQFDTKRSELGELVFRLKNRSDKATLEPLAETAAEFVRDWRISIDAASRWPPWGRRSGDRLRPSHITKNWRGRPLRTFETVVELIGYTETAAGLRVRAKLDKRTYPTGRVVTKTEMRALALHPHTFRGDWNYEVRPRPS